MFKQHCMLQALTQAEILCTTSVQAEIEAEIEAHTVLKSFYA